MSHPTHSYLLRLWREHPGAPTRATLIRVGQPQLPQHFADLEDLCVFLRAQAAEGAWAIGEQEIANCTRSESA